MCGIAGFAGCGDRRVLDRMMTTLAHRGPDGDGYHVDEARQVFFGHRRLAIVDLVYGDQPMWNEDHTVCVIFNGEIYNQAELRRLLTAAGHRFRSAHSDTEVLVHGFEEWGEGLPERLNGMFAFAIYDGERVFMARDRFGEKPLYYYHSGHEFVFASELTSVACHPAVDLTLSQRNLQKFFAYGFIPSPLTQYARVRKLRPGELATFDVATGDLALRRYWRFRLEPDESLGDAQESGLIEELRGLLVQAVERRLMSDVPVGVFLSGGIDSTAVVAAASRVVPAGALSTFTIGFTEPSFDESTHAALVARAFGTQHHLSMLDLESARDLIPDVLPRMDEPIGDASILPTFMLSRFTAGFVKTALSGDGGDELFAGYDPFAALAPARIGAATLPAPIRRFARFAMNMVPSADRNMSLDFKIKRGLLGLDYPESVRIPVWMSPIDPATMGDVFAQPCSYEDLYEEALTLWEQSDHPDPVNRALEYFTSLYLPDDILFKVDRAAMFSSLESRAIFLDNDLVAFCQRLPARFKYRRGVRKYLLKKALSTLAPEAVTRRPKKGFGVPLTKWFRSNDFEFREIEGLKSAGIQRRLREHRSGNQDHRLALWCWLSLQETLGREPSHAPVRLRASIGV